MKHTRCYTSQGKGLRVGRKRVTKYPVAFRHAALERMKNCDSVSALAEELGGHRTVLYNWQRQRIVERRQSHEVIPRLGGDV